MYNVFIIAWTSNQLFLFRPLRLALYWQFKCPFWNYAPFALSQSTTAYRPLTLHSKNTRILHLLYYFLVFDCLSCGGRSRRILFAVCSQITHELLTARSSRKCLVSRCAESLRLKDRPAYRLGSLSAHPLGLSIGSRTRPLLIQRIAARSWWLKSIGSVAETDQSLASYQLNSFGLRIFTTLSWQLPSQQDWSWSITFSDTSQDYWSEICSLNSSKSKHYSERNSIWPTASHPISRGQFPVSSLSLTCQLYSRIRIEACGRTLRAWNG